MDVLFKNRIKGYIQGLKFNNILGVYEVYMKEDKSNEEWEYVCDVDMEQMISNFKNGVWTEVKQ